MKAYKFSETATTKKPDNDNTRLLEKAMDFKPLSRKEKDRIAEICYGTFGSHFAGLRLMGWEWDLHDCLQKFVVEFTYGHLQYFHAPDKTSLRKVLSNIERIIKA